jgi:hypothetical protein
LEVEPEQPRTVQQLFCQTALQQQLSEATLQQQQHLGQSSEQQLARPSSQQQQLGQRIFEQLKWQQELLPERFLSQSGQPSSSI